MRILIVDEEVPFPPNTGKKIRTFNLLKRLQRNHKVTYVSYGTVAQVIKSHENVSFVNINHNISKSHFQLYLSLSLNCFSKLPYIVTKHYSPEMEQVVSNLLKKNKYDLLHCEWTPYTQVLRNVLPCPSVLSTHNVEALIWQRYYKNEKNILKKLYIYAQYKKVLEFEKKACHLFKEIIAVSHNDERLLKDWYGVKNITVVPNGVDAEYFRPVSCQKIPYSMVFSGSMDWRPNQDAMKYFIEEIFPFIKKENPKANLAIVGRQPPSWLYRLANKYKDITVTGTVEDIRPYIAGCVLYIVPLRIGGGTRLKIIEALAMGKPVLSTSIGAEGLQLRDGEHIVIRDTTESFANMCVEILRKPESYQDIAKKGREFVLDSYTWEAIANILEKVWVKASS